MIDFYLIRLSLSLQLGRITEQQLSSMKWFANACFVLGTILMISPQIASTSILPWLLYLVGNVVWLLDSIVVKNKHWVWMSTFFIVWDTLLVVTRVLNIEILEYFPVF